MIKKNKIIRSKAPLRIGIGGGGTDLDSYCNYYTGLVLNATISKYAHCTIHEIDQNKVIFESKDLNQKQELDSKVFFKLNGKMDLYKAVYNRIIKDNKLKSLKIKLTTFSEIPSSSGLGGSSTIVVTMIKAYDTFLNLKLSKQQIAKMAFEIEREDVGIIGGAQDQYTASFGGINFMTFHDNKKVSVNPLILSGEIIRDLEKSLILFYTRISRHASQIEYEKKSILNKKKSLDAMHRLKNNAIELKNLLENGKIKKMGELLDQSWKNKKSISEKVSNEKIDEIYDTCLKNGAFGGKISGAGGGGFMFLIVDFQKKESLINLINDNFGDVYDFQFDLNGARGWIDNE